MEFLTDPAIWLGFLTLVALELVLGIDNLIFIAILADKLPPEQRDRARIIGLTLALVMRLGLLMSISWVMSLTAPLFTAFGRDISWRDTILIVGGAFLLVKATMEIHHRLEAQPHGTESSQKHASFWPIVAQIVVLDAVFSLDSVITAIGMVEEIYVMMAAVIVAVIAMLIASKPLTKFINAHPTLVILSLGFLLMVGFVLVADGFGQHIPKGYLYAAIGFSVLIEVFNQLTQRNRRKLAATYPQRQHVADIVLRLLGGVPATAATEPSTISPVNVAVASETQVFDAMEKRMVQGVLGLANRPISTIMTPRLEVIWIDTNDSREAILATLRESPHHQFVVSRGSIDKVEGIARKEAILALYLSDKPFDLGAVIQQPPALPEGASILDALNLFKGSPIELALVVDEFGGLQGIVTQTDLFEAIAGDFPETGNIAPEMRELDDNAYEIDGAMSIYDAQERLGWGALPEGDFSTVAGFVLFLFGRIPSVDEHIDWNGWRFEVAELDGWRIDKLLVRRINQTELPSEPSKS